VSGRSSSPAARACVAALAALGLAACGSSSSSPTQLRSQATAICARANRQIGRIPTPTSATGALAFLNSGIATLRPELAQLQQLQATGDAADVWRTAVRALSDQLAALQSTASEIKGGGDPTSATKSLQQRLAPLESEANGAWQALQIPACQNQ
jgi:hypothetical protein